MYCCCTHGEVTIFEVKIDRVEDAVRTSALVIWVVPRAER